jgi:hypothetical protein
MAIHYQHTYYANTNAKWLVKVQIEVLIAQTYAPGNLHLEPKQREALQIYTLAPCFKGDDERNV